MVNVHMCGVKKKVRGSFRECCFTGIYTSQTSGWTSARGYWSTACVGSTSALSAALDVLTNEGAVTHFALPQRHGYQDAQGPDARFNNLRGLAVASNGSLRVSRNIWRATAPGQSPCVAARPGKLRLDTELINVTVIVDLEHLPVHTDTHTRNAF